MKLKNLFLISLFAASAGLYANVAQSGKWSETTTWTEGSVPTSSKTSPYTSLTVDASNITLEVDSNQYVDRLNIGDYTNTTININSGVTLAIGGATLADKSKVFISSNSASNTIHFAGDGTLSMGFSQLADSVVKPSTIVFDVNVTNPDFGGNFLYAASTVTMTANKNFQVAGQLNIQAAKFTMNGAKFSSGNFIGYGNLFFSENTTATMTSANISNVNLQGSLTVSGKYDYGDGRMAMKLNGTNTIGAKASLITKSTDVNGIVQLYGTTTSYAGEKAISFASTTYLNKNVKLILNTSNAIVTQGAASQGESTFYLVNYYLKYDWNTKVRTEMIEASIATLELGAANDFGKFVFYDASVLNIKTNGFASKIGGFTQYADGAAFSLNLSAHEDFTLKLMSLDNIQTFNDDESGLLRATNIKVADADGYEDYAYIIKDSANGGWWVNATSVPEPSTIASIFGALALALAFARGSKK